MTAAIATVIATFLMAYLAQWPHLTDYTDLGSRLRLASLSVVAPSTSLFICIARLARHRFLTPEDIQGSALAEYSDQALLLQALLQNTLEQAAFAVPLYFAASLIFPHTLLPLIPTAAILFFVGRLLFIRGYPAGAPSRAMGFALTFYPSVSMLIFVIVLALLPRAG